MKKIKLCGTCKINPVQEEHTCPYKTEINDNYELCTCCKECETECSDEI